MSCPSAPSIPRRPRRTPEAGSAPNEGCADGKASIGASVSGNHIALTAYGATLLLSPEEARQLAWWLIGAIENRLQRERQREGPEAG